MISLKWMGRLMRSFETSPLMKRYASTQNSHLNTKSKTLRPLPSLVTSLTVSRWMRNRAGIWFYECNQRGLRIGKYSGHGPRALALHISALLLKCLTSRSSIRTPPPCSLKERRLWQRHLSLLYTTGFRTYRTILEDELWLLLGSLTSYTFAREVGHKILPRIVGRLSQIGSQQRVTISQHQV